jgi:hypothetical protein
MPSSAGLKSSEYVKPSGLVAGLQRAGLLSSRNMYWYWNESTNFGDWIGPYLFQAFTGTAPLFTPKKKRYGRSCLYTAGSILGHIVREDYAVVWGSGIISRDETVARPRKVHAVRGPLSRRRLLELGFDCPDIYGDPAILLPQVYSPASPEKTHRIGFIPHCIDFEEVLGRTPAGILTIDVTRNIEDVVDEILRCEVTVSSSLHGVIVSHAYGIPSVWVQSCNQLVGDGVKFEDYFASVGSEARVHASPVGQAFDAYLALAKSATVPEVAPLVDRLRAACPFD